MTTTIPPPKNSAQAAIERFDTASAAEKYARSLGGTSTHRREIRCIRKGLASVSSGAKVLDLPCGTGRLLPLLLEMGYVVTEADSSGHMIEQARAFARREKLKVERVRFLVADALKTPFADGEFDAVVCNRLFHHFSEPETRRAGFTELRRICKGPIVVSFFCNLAYDSLVFHVRNAMARKKADDRIPISRGVLAEDARQAGLAVRRFMPSRPGISRQWYAVLEAANDSPGTGESFR